MKTLQVTLAALQSKFVLLSSLIVIALAATGCKAIQTAQFNPAARTINKHPIRVAMVVDKGLCQLEQHRDPEGYVYPLGAYLCPCIRHISTEAFAKTTEFDSPDAAFKCPDADAVLLPKFVKLEIRARGSAWDKRHTLVVLEWTLKNIKDQKTLWLSTAEGRAEGTVGSMLNMDGKDRDAFQQALDDMYRASAEAFNQSEELKNFANSLVKP
jgi:hypothetical protein